MWFKKFFKWWMYFTVVPGIILMMIFLSIGHIMDPYNVFHWDNVRITGIEPNKNYIKTKYILSNPTKYDGLLFGSSRVGAIHVDKIKGGKIYNMTYPGGVPLEHLNNLKTMLLNGVAIRRVYVGVDEILLRRKQSKNNDHMRSSYEYLSENKIEFLKMYCSPKMLVESLKFYKTDIGKANIRHKFQIKQMYTSGWYRDYNDKTGWGKDDWDKVKKVVRNKKSYFRTDCADVAINAIIEMKQLCQKKNIELIVFTNPTYHTTYVEGLNRGYIDFLRRLVNVINFYNFSGINSITIDRNNYYETSHYKAEVGDLIIDVIDKGKKYESLYRKGFGWYVTKDNIDDLVRLIEVYE